MEGYIGYKNICKKAYNNFVHCSEHTCYILSSMALHVKLTHRIPKNFSLDFYIHGYYKVIDFKYLSFCGTHIRFSL